MDLQTILACDSSSSDDGGDGAVPTGVRVGGPGNTSLSASYRLPQPPPPPSTTPHRPRTASDNSDLERILNVDSDDSDDDDNNEGGDAYVYEDDIDYNAYRSPSFRRGLAAASSDNASLGASTIATLPRHQLGPSAGGGGADVTFASPSGSAYGRSPATLQSLGARRSGGGSVGGGYLTPRDHTNRSATRANNASSGGGSSVRSASPRLRTASSSSVTSKTSHSAEDWAVLQSILDNDDDSDDMDDDDTEEKNGIGSSDSHKAAATPETTRSSRRYLQRADSVEIGRSRDWSSRVRQAGAVTTGLPGHGADKTGTGGRSDVDAIIRSMKDEGDDEDEDGDDDDYVLHFGDARATPSAASEMKAGSSVSIRSAYTMPKTTSFERSSYQNRGRGRPPRSTEEKKEPSTVISSTSRSGPLPDTMSSSPIKKSEAMTAAYLRHARNAEQKLLRPGQRDIVSPLMVKRRMKPRIEMTTASRSNKVGGGTGTGGEHDGTGADDSTAAAASMAVRLPTSATNSASMVQSKPLVNIGKELLLNSRERKFSVGLPTALAVSSKFIAIGTQKGQVLVFDHFEILKLRLGRSNSGSSSNTGGPELSPSAGSVTTIDLSHDGDALIAGYTSGLVVLWDAVRGTILKSVGDAHSSPVTSVRFLPQPGALSVVTVDAGGLVNRLTFSKMVLWSTYTVETECLLDGTAGQILATHVLPPPPPAPLNVRDDERGPGLHPGFEKLVLVALSSDRSTFSVAVEPSVSVLYRWAKPAEDMMAVDSFNSDLAATNLQANGNASDGKDIQQRPTVAPHSFLPCVSWGWAQVRGGGKTVTPILARAWGCAVQFLRASFPDTEEDANGGVSDPGVTPLWPAFGDYNEFQSSAPVVALEWLGERSLVYLTVTNEFTVVDTVMMTLVERLDFSIVKLVYAEFSLSRTASTPTAGSKGGGITVRSQCISTTFQNSIRSAEGRILILCQEDLLAVSNLGIKERVTTLEDDGEWLEALALALDHYESTVRSLEDRRRLRDGDLSKHPEFAKGGQRSEEEEWIAALLLRYMNLAVENAPEPIRDNSLGSSERGRQQSRFIDLAQGHFQMLAGVCIDFCVVTRRLDILFGPVFDCFKVARYVNIFFDVLEPYILNDKLDYIAPEAMTFFIEYCKAINDLAIVERCLLHMNVTFMDFDSVLSLLRANRMYTALLHVYGRGLDDYATPLAELFEAVFDAADDLGDITLYKKRSDGVPQNLFEQYGYKAILYIQFCLQGKTFPQGSSLEPREKVQAVRLEILHFLREEVYAAPPTIPRAGGAVRIRRGMRKTTYPYLRLLVALDPKALFDTLSIFFDEPDVTKLSEHTFGIAGDSTGLSPDYQELTTILSKIILPESDESKSRHLSSSQSKKTMNEQTTDVFLDFVAKYLLKGAITVSVPITMKILSRMSTLVMTISSTSSSNISAAQQEAQVKVLELLEALPRYSYDQKEALKIVEGAGLNRAALLLHRESLMALLHSGASKDVITHHFCSSIDCYLRDSDRDYRALVFDYIKNDCMSSIVDCAATYQESASGPLHAKDLLKTPLFDKLPELINLDAVQSAQLIYEIFVEDLEEVIASLAGKSNEISLFNFFHAIISGSLTKADQVAGPVLLANLTPDHHQKYLILMAKYHPEMMYHHLSTHDDYRVEDCLQLCQEYEVADASAYLLERMGNVSSALQLMLQTLEARLVTLKRAVRSITSENGASYRRGSRRLSQNDQVIFLTSSDEYKKQVQGVKQSLIVALDLCERNSSGTSKARTDHGSQLWFNILDRLTNAKGFLRLNKEHPSHSTVISKLLNELLESSMQRMVSCVPLSDLLRKITQDHSGSSLGEFREMLATLLKTYNTELKLRTRASDVIDRDIKEMTLERRRLKLCGHRLDPLGDGPSSAILIDTSGEGATGQEQSGATNLHRLRAKRSRRVTRQGNRGGRSSLSTFPSSADHSQRAHFGQRQIGRLSQADHYGRLE